MLLLYMVADFRGILNPEVDLPLGGVVTLLTAGEECLPVVPCCLLDLLLSWLVGDRVEEVDDDLLVDVWRQGSLVSLLPVARCHSSKEG